MDDQEHVPLLEKNAFKGCNFLISSSISMAPLPKKIQQFKQ